MILEIRLFNDYSNNRYVTYDPNTCPHQLWTGYTGSSKTFSSTVSVSKLVKYSPDSELYILDYKGDASFTPYQKFDRYFRYKECEQGLKMFHDRLTARLSGQDTSRTRIILYADELNSYLDSFSIRKEKEQQQAMISEALSMGRSLNVNVICSLIRGDSDFFRHGTRTNFSLKVGMGNLSVESKRMLFGPTDTIFKDCPLGFGYTSINGSEPIRISIPKISRFDLVQNEIIKALTNKQN